MKYADTPDSNYVHDATLKGIENGEEEGFGLPGQSAVGTVGTNTGGPFGSDTHMTSNEDTKHVTLGPATEQTVPELLHLREFGGVPMSLASRIAYVMENGQPFCNHCENYYTPRSIGVVACTNCGCGKPEDDHNLLDDNFKKVEANKMLEHVEGPTVADEARNDIIKTTDDYVTAFKKVANDGELYSQGYLDAEQGKPLDEDLAILSDDYYNGYEQYKFYNKTPQESVQQFTYDIKPQSNQIPRNFDGKLKPEDVDRGPLQLTDGIGHATASKLPFPADVISNFFEV